MERIILLKNCTWSPSAMVSLFLTELAKYHVHVSQDLRLHLVVRGRWIADNTPNLLLQRDHWIASLLHRLV